MGCGRLALASSCLGMVVALDGAICALALIPAVSVLRPPGPSPEPETATPAGSEPLVIVSPNATLGPILTNTHGKTLYVYFGDQPEWSACSATCSDNWPPLTVDDVAAATGGKGVEVQLSVFARDDGTLQVAANHMPLYYWIGDHTPGEAGGEGAAAMWYALSPTGQLAPVPKPTARP